jgi:hypothetical protein
MNPLVEQLAVGLLIAGAIAFFLVRYLRKRAAGKNCGGDCGCSATSKLPPVEK